MRAGECLEHAKTVPAPRTAIPQQDNLDRARGALRLPYAERGSTLLGEAVHMVSGQRLQTGFAS
jgi:hypothetical protein